MSSSDRRAGRRVAALGHGQCAASWHAAWAQRGRRRPRPLQLVRSGMRCAAEDTYGWARAFVVLTVTGVPRREPRAWPWPWGRMVSAERALHELSEEPWRATASLRVMVRRGSRAACAEEPRTAASSGRDLSCRCAHGRSGRAGRRAGGGWRAGAAAGTAGCADSNDSAVRCRAIHSAAWRVVAMEARRQTPLVMASGSATCTLRSPQPEHRAASLEQQPQPCFAPRPAARHHAAEARPQSAPAGGGVYAASSMLRAAPEAASQPWEQLCPARPGRGDAHRCGAAPRAATRRRLQAALARASFAGPMHALPRCAR